MRKLFTLLLAVLASTTTLFAWDYERLRINGLYYNLNSSNQTAEVTYESVSYSTFNNEWDIKTADIPTSVIYNGTEYRVTSIGNHAFCSCYKLTSVTIPNSVTSIENSAFENCSSLISITIPNSVISIGNSAFKNCSSLISITIPNSVISIGNSAFENCNWLPVENNIRYADTYLVGVVDKTQPTYIIKQGTKWIASEAFKDCITLISIEIPNSVTSIGNYAFSGCSSLTSVTIGNSVTYIGEYAFKGCSGLTSVHISDIAAWCAIFYGRTDDNPLIYAHNLYLNGTLITDLVIPNSVTSIGNYAFRDCTSLKSVTIPNSVTSIGHYAFRDCTSLKSVTIGNSVTSIGDGAFYECSSLTSVTIPNSVTSIGSSAFSGCSGLTSVTIPNSVTSIGRYAFYGCTGLTSVTIPNSVTSIGNEAFSGCYNLPVIDNIRYADTYLVCVVDKTQSTYTIKQGTKWIGNEAFKGCTGLTSITIPNSITSIGEAAFSGCSGLTSVTINSNLILCKGQSVSNYFGSYVKEYILGTGITNIGGSAFSGCSGLTSIMIPNSVTSIGNGAFSGCSSLTAVTIPNSVTSIGDYAFEKCRGLTSVTIPDSVTSIGGYAFRGCTSLPVENNIRYADTYLAEVVDKTQSTYTIKQGTKWIDISAFYGLTQMTSVIIPNSVTSIGQEAFYGCSITAINYIGSIEDWCNKMWGPYEISSSYRLLLKGVLQEDITIPNSFTGIGEYAFYGCSGLTSVTIPNSVTSIGYGAFEGCSGLTSVTIPNSVTSIGEEAFYGCSSLTSVTIPYGVTSIGDYAFSRCSSLTAVTIPNSVTSIGNYAFYLCAGLTAVTIPNSVTSIGDYAFSVSYSERSFIFVTIPNSVTKIGKNAFEYRSGSANFESTNPPQMGEGCMGSLYCYIPCGTSQAYHDSLPSTSFSEGHIYYIFNNTQTEDFNKLMIDNPSVWTYSDKYGAYGKKQGGATGYLMTPPQDLSNKEDLSDKKLNLFFRHTHRYAKEPFENEMSLWVTADYKGSVEASEWKQLTITDYASNNDWYFVDCTINVPKSYVGPNTVFAFKYTSTASSYATWEITNISLKTICDDGTPDTYNITFKDWDGTILQSTQVEEGFLPQYNGDTPTRPEDDLYTYTFSGWTPQIVAVTADAIYTATYTENQKGATPVETDNVAVTPFENTADIVWPSVSGAATYELVIRDESGNVICKLVFNAQGYLTSIAFHAPSRENAPKREQFAGFEFTITGLDEGTTYTFELTAKDSDGTIINSESGVFTTLGEQQAIDNTPFLSGEGRGEATKLLRNGQVFILRGDKTYTLQGQEIK